MFFFYGVAMLSEDKVIEYQKIIHSVTRNPDVVQDVWVELLEKNISDEQSILAIAKKTERRYINEWVKRKRKESRYNDNVNPLIRKNRHKIRMRDFRINDIRCIYCGNRRIVKNGHTSKNQRYYCRDCKRTFRIIFENEIPPKGYKHPLSHIKYAVSLKKEGMSESKMRSKIEEKYGYRLSSSTVHEWANYGK